MAYAFSLSKSRLKAFASRLAVEKTRLTLPRINKTREEVAGDSASDCKEVVSSNRLAMRPVWMPHQFWSQ
jgi:hypothetical protein